jgi:hypothetical protein
MAAAAFAVIVGAAGSASAQTTGACCKPDASCLIVDPGMCEAFQGTFYEGLRCFDVVCEVPTTSTTSTTVKTTTTVKPTTTTTTIKAPEGCTPGYWRQDQHFDSWVDYAPGDSFDVVFGRDVPGSPTLLDAVWARGGGLNALMRHAVAALLNASNPDVNPVAAFNTPAEVIDAFQAAFDSGDYETTKNLFAASNEAGCPLN